MQWTEPTACWISSTASVSTMSCSFKILKRSERKKKNKEVVALKSLPLWAKILQFQTFHFYPRTMDNSHSQHESVPSSSLSLISTSNSQENNEEHHPLQEQEEQQQPRRQSSGVSYRVNISTSDVAASGMRDDVWYCLVVLVTFWFFGQFLPLLWFFSITSVN